MATPGGADAGKLLISNATPCVWKLTDSKKHNMPVWEFPEEVNPGETVVALIQFGKDGGGNPGPSGVACYQVEMPDGEGELPQLKVKANRKGMNLGLSENMSRKAGWFCVPPPPHRVANKGWNRSCLVSCTVAYVGGDEGYTLRSNCGFPAECSLSIPEVGEKLDRSEVFPVRVSDTPDDESAERGDGDEEDEGGCFGGFFGGIGRTLMDAKDGVGDMLTDCGVLPPGRPSGGRGEGRWTENWMRFFGPALANLKLKDLSIPGTHNSGTCSMQNPIVGPWASTQNLTIEEQLKSGVRALDIRVGYAGESEDGASDGVFITHDAHCTNVSLREACRTLKAFVSEHDGEIVFLDFHRFPDLGNGPPHEKAAQVVLDELQEVMIEPSHRNLPLGRLMAEQQGRVVVLWNAKEARDELFWNGVRQAWNGSENISTLHQLATDELGEKKRGMWSLPLVLPAGVPRPVPHIPSQLDNWMTTGRAWQENANIVSVDFVEETQIVRNCVGASLLKAARASGN